MHQITKENMNFILSLADMFSDDDLAYLNERFDFQKVYCEDLMP